MMKLFKDSESGSSAVGVGGTDVNEQPLKGGNESAASYGNMEVNALLAHGAKDLLREVKNVKGQRFLESYSPANSFLSDYAKLAPIGLSLFFVQNDRIHMCYLVVN